MTRTLKVGAVHAVSPLWNKEEALDKATKFIHEAGEQKTDLLVFPEVFVPGYPIYTFAYPPLQYTRLLKEYVEQSMTLFENDDANESHPTKDLVRIQEACKAAAVTVVLGISERSGFNPHTLFISQVFVGSDGKLLGVHRKLIPTYVEQSVWAQGGGATLRCWQAPLPSTMSGSSSTYMLGGLSCIENALDTARYALIAAGEEVHAASFPSMRAFRRFHDTYLDRQKTLVKSHAYSGGVFVVCASSIIRAEHLAWIENRLGPDTAELLVEGSGWSGVVDPVVGVLVEEEGGLHERIVSAEIDLDRIAAVKVSNDSGGHDRRPEVLRLGVDRRAVWEDDLTVACITSSQVQYAAST